MIDLRVKIEFGGLLTVDFTHWNYITSNRLALFDHINNKFTYLL